MKVFLHGYYLEGSGSNLWTRELLRGLAKLGHHVHLFCQELEPEVFDFISSAHFYPLDGDVKRLFERKVPYPGSVTCHRPEIGATLPVYVHDHYKGFERAVPMVELGNSEIQAYLKANLAALQVVAETWGKIEFLHANHSVLMSVVAERYCEKSSASYAVMPHGSALEYAVKPDQRFFDFARSAFQRAQKIFVSGPELKSRLGKIYPQDSFEDKTMELPLGVDTSRFKIVPRAERPNVIEQLKSQLQKIPRAKPGSEEKLPDEGLEDRLNEIDWVNEKIVVFAGRLIEAKGVRQIFAALPEIVRAEPSTRFVIIGHGPLREKLERGLKEGPRAVFTGFLGHTEMSLLLSCSDVTIFPSLVPESGPLVFLEAIACGSFPMGTYFAGTRASIDSIEMEVPVAVRDEVMDLMKLSPDPSLLPKDLIRKIPKAVNLDTRGFQTALRNFCERNHDWESVAASWWKNTF